jgi:hypothetical protein
VGAGLPAICCAATVKPDTSVVSGASHTQALTNDQNSSVVAMITCRESPIDTKYRLTAEL